MRMPKFLWNIPRYLALRVTTVPSGTFHQLGGDAYLVAGPSSVPMRTTSTPAAVAMA